MRMEFITHNSKEHHASYIIKKKWEHYHLIPVRASIWGSGDLPLLHVRRPEGAYASAWSCTTSETESVSGLCHLSEEQVQPHVLGDFVTTRNAWTSCPRCGGEYQRHRVKALTRPFRWRRPGNVKEMISGAKHLSDREADRTEQEGTENSITKLPMPLRERCPEDFAGQDTATSVPWTSSANGVKKDVHQDMVDMPRNCFRRTMKYRTIGASAPPMVSTSRSANRSWSGSGTLPAWVGTAGKSIGPG